MPDGILNKEDVEELVNMIFVFDPVDDLEKQAFAETIGGIDMYNAIMKYKEADNGLARATEFILKLQTCSGISRLLL